MASPTYPLRALVLRKTKLSEADLIITLLAQDGSLKRGVAKGARKPKSTFASRLELFSDVELLMVQGKNLDIISEVRIIDARAPLRDDLIRCAAGACALELFTKLAQEDLPGNRLFALAQAYFAALITAQDAHVPLLTAAELLKAMAVSGFEPCVDACILCGTPTALQPPRFVPYSFADGGPLCPLCSAGTATQPLGTDVLATVAHLLHTPFATLATHAAPPSLITDTLLFAATFIETHCQTRLKSLTFFQSVTIPFIFPCETAPRPLQ